MADPNHGTQPIELHLSTAPLGADHTRDQRRQVESAEKNRAQTFAEELSRTISQRNHSISQGQAVSAYPNIPAHEEDAIERERRVLLWQQAWSSYRRTQQRQRQSPRQPRRPTLQIDGRVQNPNQDGSSSALDWLNLYA